MIGFRPASDGRISVPVSLCARSVRATAGLTLRVGFLASTFILIFALLLSPLMSFGASASAVASVSAAQIAGVDRLDETGNGKMGAVVASRPGSTDVSGKIEAIRRMGTRVVLRTFHHHDLIAAGGGEKLAESTENFVRVVTLGGPCRASVHEGLGRAPPRLDL